MLVGRVPDFTHEAEYRRAPAERGRTRLHGKADDVRADVYSLGVMVYEMLTARLPHDGEFWNVASLLLARMDQDPIPLRQVDERFPPALERIVSASLDRNVKARPSAEDFTKGSIEALAGGG